MNTPIIRPALDSDCKSVAACAKAAYQLYIERIGKPPAPMVADFKSQIAENKVYVLEQNPAPQPQPLLGFVVCFVPDERRAESGQAGRTYFLENIAIDPNVQRAGYGFKLVKHVIALARESCCGTIELYTNELMTENILWYKKLGFTEFDRVYEDGFSRVYMRLVL